MKGLLIAYYFSPDKRVGALRPTYWADEIANLDSIQLDVLTATETNHPNAQYIPNRSKSLWSKLIKDEGVTWKIDLLNYFQSIDLKQYDFAIITCGPFMHMTLSKVLKKHGLKVIIDFRDPFFNPMFQDKWLKKSIKQFVEKKALKYADLIISVNHECHELIDPNNKKIQRAIIPNGFDERMIPKNKSHKINSTFFCAGKFYLNPDSFFQVIKNNNQKITHAGVESYLNHPFNETGLYEYTGIIPQDVLYEKIQHSEIGVVFTDSYPHLSTTKIYDYIGLNKKILIITEGSPNEGALNRELSQYPFYRWVKNDPLEIQKAIEELSDMIVYPVDTHQFSRQNGLITLINLIKNI